MTRDTRTETHAQRLTAAESLLLEALDYLPEGDDLKRRIGCYLEGATSLGDDTAIAVQTVNNASDAAILRTVRAVMAGDAGGVVPIEAASDEDVLRSIREVMEGVHRASQVPAEILRGA